MGPQPNSQQALARAYRLLAHRPRSGAEIRLHLRSAGFGEVLVEDVLRTLTARGFIDDRAFARAWTESRMAFRPRARRLIVKELTDKGVAEEIANEVTGDIDDEPVALAIAARRASALKELDRASFIRRLSRYLSSRGFDYGTVAHAVRAVCGDDDHS
jgi:regulatory protein